MVAVPEAVVDEGAVVVEVLDALVADSAVEGGLGLDNLTIGAEVVEVETDV